MPAPGGDAVSAGRVKTIHGELEIPRQQTGQTAFRVINGTLYRFTLSPRRPTQHITDHLLLAPGVTDPNAQSPEITTPQGGDTIAQPVMPGMTTTQFEFDTADR